MALYAIADLHLSLGTDKPMDDFPGWSGYVDRLQKNWIATVSEQDAVVIPGDISWGMSLQEALPDFRFLQSLPGQKLLLKGNHDYWWNTRKKMENFFSENGLSSLTIIHNDSYDLGDGRAVCGTRGWFYDAEADEDKKILMREIGRLHASITHAEDRGLTPVVFLHYPPLFGGTVCQEMMNALTEHKIWRCYYGHIHGHAIKQAFTGVSNGVAFHLISGDHLGFRPALIP